MIVRSNNISSLSNFFYMLVGTSPPNFCMTRYTLYLLTNCLSLKISVFVLVYALELIFPQVVVGAFRMIPKASWNGKERLVRL